jgi:hypothetical protein
MKKLFFTITLFAMASTSFGFKIPFINYDAVNKYKVGATYLSADDEGMIFSWASGGGYTSNVRFSAFLNTGVKYNYNVAKGVALFSGLTLRNVGTADRNSLTGSNKTIVTRARNYYIGIPLGVRIGDFRKKTEIDFGGGVDFTLHHKQKQWDEGSRGSTKVKFNCEWFDNKYSQLVNPYIFVAAKVRGTGLKFQYYTGEFLKGSNTNLMYVSVLMGGSGKMSANRKTKKVKKSIDNI